MPKAATVIPAGPIVGNAWKGDGMGDHMGLLLQGRKETGGQTQKLPLGEQ